MDITILKNSYFFFLLYCSNEVYRVQSNGIKSHCPISGLWIQSRAKVLPSSIESRKFHIPVQMFIRYRLKLYEIFQTFETCGTSDKYDYISTLETTSSYSVLTNSKTFFGSITPFKRIQFCHLTFQIVFTYWYWFDNQKRIRFFSHQSMNLI